MTQPLIVRPQFTDCFVTRGHSLGKPYDVVTRLPKDEAIKICEAIWPARGEGEPNADGHRNQTDYWHLRVAGDNWLREQAMVAGVRIDDAWPVAFLVSLDQEHNQMSGMQPNGKSERVTHAIRDLDLSNWSFTFDDSIANYVFAKSGRKVISKLSDPLQGRIMNAQQLSAALGQNGIIKSDGTPHFIEAQMWARKPTFIAAPDVRPIVFRGMNKAAIGHDGVPLIHG